MSRRALILNSDGRPAQSPNLFVETTDPVTKIQNILVDSGVATSGVFLRYNGSTWKYFPISDIDSNGNVIVDNIRGIPISSLVPADGNILVYDAGINTWVPATQSFTVKYVGGTEYEAETIEVSGAIISNPSLGVVRLTFVGGGGGGSISIREEDSSPSMSSVTQIVVSNGDLVDEGGGVARIKTAGDATTPIGSLLYMYREFY